MAAIAAETARGARASGDVFSGALLASGAAALFVGTLFYARLTPELGLPALPPERTQALADALKLGPQPLALAGGFAFLGDCLLLAAWLAFASRRPPAGEPLLPRRVSYVGIAIGAAAPISGLGAALGMLHLPLVIGLSVTFGCVILAALGVQIARRGPAGGARGRGCANNPRLGGGRPHPAR